MTWLMAIVGILAIAGCRDDGRSNDQSEAPPAAVENPQFGPALPTEYLPEDTAPRADG